MIIAFCMLKTEYFHQLHNFFRILIVNSEVGALMPSKDSYRQSPLIWCCIIHPKTV